MADASKTLRPPRLVNVSWVLCPPQTIEAHSSFRRPANGSHAAGPAKLDRHDAHFPHGATISCRARRFDDLFYAIPPGSRHDKRTCALVRDASLSESPQPAANAVVGLHALAQMRVGVADELPPAFQAMTRPLRPASWPWHMPLRLLIAVGGEEGACGLHSPASPHTRT